MDPKNQTQFNSKTPISEVLKQEQTGFVPSTPNQTTNPIPVNSTQGAKVSPQSSQIKIIKTYSSDVAEAMKAQQETVTKIAMAQEEHRREQGEEIGARPVPRRRVGLLLPTIILIALGAIAIPAVKYILNQKTAEVAVNTEKTIVPFDHQETLTLNNATRNDFIGALNELQTKTPAASTINYIKVLEKIQDVNKNTVTQKISPNVFAGLIGPNMPSALARSFDSDYMFGLADADNQKPFIILKTSSYQQTFANMLRWEARMTTDLNPVFNFGSDVLGRPFTDKVVINKDVRAITTLDGTIVFLYGFLDNQTLVITTNSQTFQDLNSRYIAARFVQ